MNGSNKENRILKGIVCYRGEDGSFENDIREIYYDAPKEEELTEQEKAKLSYFTEKVLAPMFKEYAKSLKKREHTNNA